jgi:CDP-diacylglycerol--glycerol-3-phosphate 3-phosphatidyltransferase
MSHKTADNVDGISLLVTKKVYTLANLFSLSRILITIPIVWSYEVYADTNWIFTTLIAYGIFSDYLDGWAARRQNEVSELGKIIDPLADKIMAGVLFIYATYLGLIPLAFLALTLGRDLLILMGSIYISKTRGKVAMSIMSGKIFVNILAIYWLMVMYFPENKLITTILMWFTVAFLIGSFAEYVMRFFRIVKGAEFN